MKEDPSKVTRTRFYLAATLLICNGLVTIYVVLGQYWWRDYSPDPVLVFWASVCCGFGISAVYAAIKRRARRRVWVFVFLGIFATAVLWPIFAYLATLLS